MEIPEIQVDREHGPLTEPHPIWISKEMFDEIQSLKNLYGKRAVNKWLRSLWRFGIEQQKVTEEV